MSKITNSPLHYYTENNIRYVFLAGNLCDRISDCFNMLRQQLSFPDYFSNNLDSLEEIMADLEWIPESEIKIIILNTDSLLKKDIEKKPLFLDIINNTGNEKIEIIYLK